METRMFITVATIAGHWYPSWARSVGVPVEFPSSGFSLKQSTNSDFVYNRTKTPDTSCMKSYEHFHFGANVFMVVTKPCFLWDTRVRPKKYLTIWAQQSGKIKVGCPSVAKIRRNLIQGPPKRFERFKFGIFYVLIVKIRNNFTHK